MSVSLILYSYTCTYMHESKKYRYQAVKQRNNQNSKSKDKIIRWNKETQMTGQHEPLWKPEVKPGAPEGIRIDLDHL